MSERAFLKKLHPVEKKSHQQIETSQVRHLSPEALRRYTERLRTLRALDGVILAAWSPEEIAQCNYEPAKKVKPARRPCRW